MLRGQALPRPAKHSRTLLAVVFGKNRGSSDLQPNEQATFNLDKPGIRPGNAFSSASAGRAKYLKAGEDRNLDELSDISAAGRLEVQVLANPTKNELRVNLETSEPELVYFQGEQVTIKDETGGDVNISTPDAIVGLFGSKVPNLVYLEIPNGGELGEALRAKIRGSKLHNRVSAPPPPLAAATFARGVITMRCDMCTSSFAHISLLVSGSAQTCFDDQLLECNIKKELVEKDQLVQKLTMGEGNKITTYELRQSVAVASGATVFEVWMRIPTWAAQVLRQLAPELSYRSLVALGIAGIQGFPVAAFQKADADRLLSYWMNQDRKCGSIIQDQKISHNLSYAPYWLQPPVSARKRINIIQTNRQSINNNYSDDNDGKSSMKLNQNGATNNGVLSGRSTPALLSKQNQAFTAMKPIPHTVKHRLVPFVGTLDADNCNGTPQKVSTSNVPSGRHLRTNLSSVLLADNAVSSRPVTHSQKSGSISSHSQYVLSLNPLPMKKHGCDRCPIQECSEEDFLKDVMQFLIVRGHARLVPAAGLDEFPDAILNAKRLDLYNLYREVVSRGGFYVGNGINWKGQVFSKMRNHTSTNRMTGVGNTLKRHYETYLLEYELAHDDVDGECCILCHSSAAGDWVNCGICGEWAHFGCDRRTGLGAFKDYAKTDGLEYICPRCSASNFRALSGRKAQRSPNGLTCQALAI